MNGLPFCTSGELKEMLAPCHTDVQRWRCTLATPPLPLWLAPLQRHESCPFRSAQGCRKYLQSAFDIIPSGMRNEQHNRTSKTSPKLYSWKWPRACPLAPLGACVVHALRPGQNVQIAPGQLLMGRPEMAVLPLGGSDGTQRQRFCSQPERGQGCRFSHHLLA